MRSYYTSYTKDQNGRIIASATVNVYLAGTETAASIYTTLTGATAVNSVTSDANGKFEFYVSRFDYDVGQQFKLVISKAVSTTASYANVTLDYIQINSHVLGTYTISADTTVATALGEIPEGVIYSVAAGKTLTITGAIDAGMYQIFTGTGTVTFGPTSGVSPYVEWFGAGIDTSGLDSTTAIQNALNSGWSYLYGFFDVHCGSQSYLLSSTIIKPVNVRFYGHNAVIHLNASGTYTGNYAILDNSTDGTTATVGGSSGYFGSIDGFYFNNTAAYALGLTTPIAIGLGSGSTVENIHTNSYAGTVKTIGVVFLDMKKISNLFIESHKGTNPMIEINGYGDMFEISRIHPYAPASTADVIKISNAKGGTIHSMGVPTNTNINLVRCKGVEVSGVTFEGGTLTATGSNFGLSNSVFFKVSSGSIPITLVNDASATNSHFLATLSGVTFLTDYRRSYTSSPFDIEQSSQYAIAINGVHSSVTFNDGLHVNEQLFAPAIKHTTLAAASLFNQVSPFVPNGLIPPSITGVGLDYAISAHFPTSAFGWLLSVSSASIAFSGATATYYYRVAFLLDPTRMIGAVDSAAEQSIALTNTAGYTSGASLQGSGSVHRTASPNHFLRVYRGTSAATYDYYVDIPAYSHTSRLYDDGAALSGFTWIARTPGGVDTFYTGSGITRRGTVIEVRGVGAAPTVGTWKLGDRVLRSPSVGQPKAWVCTVAGTPGTWVSEGNL